MTPALAQAEVAGAIPPWITSLVAGVVALFVLMRLAAAAARVLEGAPGTPRAHRSEARRQARRGEHEKAGDLFRAAGEPDDLEQAIEQYKQAGSHSKAAELLASRGNLEAAAALFEKAHMWEPAAEAYRRAGNVKRAEASYLKAGQKIQVARMYEDAGQHAKAAALYRECGRLDRAADLFERTGKHLEAAAALEKTYFHSIAGLSDKRAAAAREDARKLEERIVSLLRKAEQLEKAVDFYVRAGLYGQAAEVCLEVGKADKAIDLFLRCGNEERAAELLEARGDRNKSARLRGDAAMRQGDLAGAAQHFERSGEIRLAAEAYEKLGENLKAAESFQRVGDPAQAAFFYARAGDYRRAGELYESAGDLEAALRCYDTLGDEVKRAAILVKAGKHARAGAEYVRLKRWDEAIAALQRLAPSAPDMSVANSLLGIAFVEKGLSRLGLEKIDAALAAPGGSFSFAPPRVEILYYRARALEALGDIEQAVLAYERVVSVDAAHRDAAQRLESLNVRAATAVGANARAREPQGGRTEIIAGAAPGQGSLKGDPLATARSSLPMRQPERSTLPRGTTAIGGDSVDGEAKTVGPGSLHEGRYRIMEEIGRGGMGVVYKCHDTLLDRIIAYKVLSSQIRDFPAALENFLREAKSAARLNHPNVVTLYDFGEHDAGYYMTLEYVAGKNLRQFVKAKPEPEQLRGVLAGICEGLAYAHGNAVIHRDIKPSNILIADLNSRAKILDFGLAKIVEDVSATASGVLGTPWYMSPEQVLGTQVSHQSDIYSLGITLFEVITGELPFKGRDFGYHHVHTQPPAPRSVNAAVSEDMDRIILKCIEKKPEDRFADALALEKAIRSAKL